jgi:simple sugar transport system substrate-binding protein
VFVTRSALPKEQISTADLSKHVNGWGGSQQGYTEYLKQAEAASVKK